MVGGDGVLDHDPAVLFSEDLDPVIGGNHGFSAAAAQIVFTGAGIDGILFTAREADLLRAEQDLKSAAEIITFIYFQICFKP